MASEPQTDKIITATEHDGIVIVRFNRSQIFDIEAAEELTGELRELAGRLSGRQWVIDMTGVELIITPVVSGLLSTLRSDRESGGDIFLCGMEDTIKRVIHLAHLDRVFSTYETLDQALAAARGAKPS